MHLYRNGYVLDVSLSHKEIYQFLTNVASHKLYEFYNKEPKYKKYFRIEKIKEKREFDDDGTVSFMEYWIRKNTAAKTYNSKPIKWHNLKSCLAQHNIEVTEDKSNQKYILTLIKQRLFFSKKIQKSYPHDGIFCYPNTVKQIRTDFSLKKEDGFDDNTFFSEDVFLDETIVTYKKIIYRLSLT